MTSLGVAAIGAGLVLIASGVKDLDPRAVFLAIFTGKPLPVKGSGKAGAAEPGAGGGIAGVPGSGPQSTLPPGTTGSGGGGGGSTSW